MTVRVRLSPPPPPTAWLCCSQGCVGRGLAAWGDATQDRVTSRGDRGDSRGEWKQRAAGAHPKGRHRLEKRKKKTKKKEEGGKKKKKETKQCLYAFSHRPVLLEPSEVFSLKFPKNVSLRETPSMGKCRPSSAPASAGGGQPERGRVGSLRVKEGGG